MVRRYVCVFVVDSTAVHRETVVRVVRPRLKLENVRSELGWRVYLGWRTRNLAVPTGALNAQKNIHFSKDLQGLARASSVE